MVGVFGVEVVEAPRTKATKGSPLERQEWAYTFAYVHQTGPLAAAVLVRCAHVAGITYDDDGAVKYMHEFFESRALTAAMLQHQRVAITKAVKLLVGLGALIPNGRHRYTNGKATECYQLGGMFTEWQVLSPAQADAVDVVRQAEEVAEEVSVNKTSDVASGNTNRETITWVEPAEPLPINSELLEMAAGPTDSLEILNKYQHGFNPSLCCLTQRQIEERTRLLYGNLYVNLSNPSPSRRPSYPAVRCLHHRFRPNKLVRRRQTYQERPQLPGLTLVHARPDAPHHVRHTLSVLLNERVGAPAAQVSDQRRGAVRHIVLRVAEVLAAVVEVDHEYGVVTFLAGKESGYVVVPPVLGKLDAFD